MKFEDIKEYIDLQLKVGANYENAFILAVEFMEV